MPSRKTVNRRAFLKQGAALALASGASLQSAALQNADRPNVLWIVFDSARAKNFSCYGYARKTSPNLERMASEGLLCEETYSQAFWTAPSLSCYMTGRYFPEWVVETSNTAETTLLMPPKGELLAPTVFADNGYATLLLPANLGYVTPTSRLAQAFHQVFIPGDATWPSWSPKEDATQEVTFREINAVLLQWLYTRRQSKQPFFAYVHAVDTHSPYVIPMQEPYNQWLVDDYQGQFVKNFKMTFPGGQKKRVTPEDRDQLQGLYDGTILHADYQIGILLQALEMMDMADNTLVVISSDHGESLLEDLETHGHSGKPGFAGPDETHRIPLLMRGPGIPKGLRLPGLTESIDILPTLLELCGIQPQSPMDGHSLVDSFDADAAPPKRRMAFTKGDFHDILGAPPKNNEDIDRVFLRTKDRKCEWNRAFPERSLVWEAPDQRADRTEIQGEDKEDFLREAAAYFESHLYALESQAQANIAPRYIVFSCSNPQLFVAPKARHLRLSEGMSPLSDEDKTHWITDHRVRAQDALLCFPAMEAETCHLQILRVVYGPFRLLFEMYSGQFEQDLRGSAIDIGLDGGPFRRIQTEPNEGTPRWEWIDYGPMKIQQHGLNLYLRGTAEGCRIRRVVLVSDIPGALDLVKSRIVKDTHFSERQDARQEALKALGYL